MKLIPFTGIIVNDPSDSILNSVLFGVLIMKRILLILAVATYGCGTNIDAFEDSKPGFQAMPGPEGPEGPQGPPGENFVLSWANINGGPGGGIFASGGPIEILSFERVSTGVYEIVYDALTIDSTLTIAPLVSGFGFEISDGGENLVHIVSGKWDLESILLTFQVFSVLSVIDQSTGISLVDADTVFSLVLVGAAGIENE